VDIYGSGGDEPSLVACLATDRRALCRRGHFFLRHEVVVVF
jgi:hypothetical protein